MEILDLTIAMAVAKEQHFTNAAYELYMSESTLSKRVANLEKELGVALFDRSTRRVSLTPAGEVFLPYAEKILQEYERLQAALKAVPSDTLVIGAISNLSRLGLSASLSQFIAKYPDVRIEMVHGNTSELLALLTASKLDLMFGVLNDDILGLTTADHYPVLEDEMVLVMHKDHPLAANAVISLAQLSGEKFISLSASSGTEKFLASLFKTHGIAPQIIHHCAQTEIILRMLEEKKYVSLLAKKVFFASSPGSDIAYRPLEKPIRRITALVAPKTVKNRQAIRNFIAHIIANPFE